MNKMEIDIYLSTVILNESGLSVQIKRQRVAEWIRKQDPYNMLSSRNSPQMKDTD